MSDIFQEIAMRLQDEVVALEYEIQQKEDKLFHQAGSLPHFLRDQAKNLPACTPSQNLSSPYFQPANVMQNQRKQRSGNQSQGYSAFKIYSLSSLSSPLQLNTQVKQEIKRQAEVDVLKRLADIETQVRVSRDQANERASSSVKKSQPIPSGVTPSKGGKTSSSKRSIEKKKLAREEDTEAD